jgi:hypothetical protein
MLCCIEHRRTATIAYAQSMNSPRLDSGDAAVARLKQATDAGLPVLLRGTGEVRVGRLSDRPRVAAARLNLHAGAARSAASNRREENAAGAFRWRPPYGFVWLRSARRTSSMADVKTCCTRHARDHKRCRVFADPARLERQRAVLLTPTVGEGVTSIEEVNRVLSGDVDGGQATRSEDARAGR